MAQYIVDNRPAPVDMECNSDPIQRTLQNVKNLLMTRMGEIPYDRKRGLDPALLDLPISDMNSELLPELDRAMAWEPDAKVIDGLATLDENGETIITIMVEINL